MFKLIGQATALLTAREKRHIKWLFLATLVTALIEVTGIASILPFIMVVVNRDVIHTNQFLRVLYDVTGVNSPDHFLMLVGMLVLLVLTVGNGFAALTTWLLMRFAYLCGHTVSERLLMRYLGQPYEFFLNRNTAELNKNMLSEVHRFVAGVLLPSVRMLSKLVVVVFILGMLVVVDPLLALIAVLVLGSAYVAIYGLIRRRLLRIGKESVGLASSRFKVASEALGAIKELKVLGREYTFLNRYSESSRQYALLEASSEVFSMIPRYALETLAFGGIMLIVVYLLSVKQGVQEILPLVGLYAFAGVRLVPSMQQIFAGLTKLRYHSAVIRVLYADLVEEPSAPLGFGTEDGKHTSGIEHEIDLRDVNYVYPGAATPVIDALNLTIRTNSTVGIVGPTGSGKTTLVDIILGLLRPARGGLYVDGRPITEWNIRHWRKSFGYVPQTIYLSDDTVARNIAFGIKDAEIDSTAVERAARIAALHDFVVRELPHGYQTIVGERGVRLSGGQRQRIGIARALYHDPPVLVLDEATSALDVITESVIMDAIRHLSHRKTILVIAHRLATVRECDVIYLLDRGRIIASGTYEDMIESSQMFRQMADVRTPSP